MFKLFSIGDMIHQRVNSIKEKLNNLVSKKKLLNKLLIEKEKKNQEFVVFLFIFCFILFVIKKKYNKKYPLNL